MQEEAKTLDELIYDNGLEKSEIESWTKGGKIIKMFDNKNNMCLLIEFKHDEKDKNPLYQYQRFFTIGDKTVCSVDKEFHKSDLKDVEYAAAILIGFETNEKYI